MNVDIIKALLIPPLEILANPEYQERVWVNKLDPNLSDSYEETLEAFEICSNLFQPGEEDKLDEKNRKSLEKLYKTVREFYLSCTDSDIHSLINRPDWVEIQRKARELVDALYPIAAARSRDVIEKDLIPSVEKLASRTYQKQAWVDPKGESTYSKWFMNFSEICDFLLSTNQGYLNQENKRHLRELYEKVDDFDYSWGRTHDVLFLINHPDWVEIQRIAAEFLERLKNR